MTIIQALISVICGVALLVLLCGLVVFVEKKVPWEQYDERQRIARGNAYRVAFFVGIFYYFAALIFVRRYGDESGVATYFLFYLGLVLQIMSFHIYCLLTHAALPLSEKPTFAIVFYLVLGALCTVSVIVSYDYGTGIGASLLAQGMGFDGYASNIWVDLILGVCAFLLGLMHLLQWFRNRKEE